MNWTTPPAWLLGCSCFAPAALSLSIDAVLRHRELHGKISGDALGIAPTAGMLTVLICVIGSLLPAIWVPKKQSFVETIVVWGGLAAVNLALTVPGCVFIWS